MIQLIQAILMEEMGTSSPALAWSLFIVGILLIVFTLIGLGVSIWLAIKYVKFNRKQNSAGLTGENAARKILDMNDLQHIKVSAAGSILFGNSYSHIFKKVRLRRKTYKKDSISSLAMAAQKSALAVLDKEQDPDMLKRNKMIPFITLGPFFMIPLVLVGVLLDALTKYANEGMFTLVFSAIGLLFYVCSFVFSITVLKLEKKGQEKAYTILRENDLATGDELADIQSLFKLYNIEYINNIILAFLEVVYNIPRIILLAQNKGSSSSKSRS